MWIWRKMQRISWTEKKTNESVRMEIGIEEDETLQQTALRRKLGFFGHVMRSDGLEKRKMLAHGDGRRRIVIVNSKLLKRHSKAKRRAPAYSRALRQIRGVFQ